jgi:hypothetical protein
VKLMPATRRGRLALAGGLLALLLGAYLAQEAYDRHKWDRRGEAHFRGRPTSWWDDQLTRRRDEPEPSWRTYLRRLGLPVAESGPLAELRNGGPDAAPVLAELLASRDHDNGSYASLLLRHLGPSARGVVPALLPLLAHPDEHVRRETWRVLEGIDYRALYTYLRKHPELFADEGKHP